MHENPIAEELKRIAAGLESTAERQFTRAEEIDTLRRGAREIERLQRLVTKTLSTFSRRDLDFG